VPDSSRSVALVTLGCGRNEVDSEELAGRLDAAGWALAQDADDADVVVVNTCGFIDAAKKDSIDALIAAADSGRKVVAVGCLAERYGRELAAELPEAAAVLGFDAYPDIAARLDDVAAGRPISAHVPHDRRALLPIAPAHRPAAAVDVAVPGHAWVPTSTVRARLDDGPVAYLKLASGCDRRCTFCAIPTFRGAFVSRQPADVLSEAGWLADHGARELVLVSENSTSYGKDLGDLRALEKLLPRLAQLDGIARVRVSYLQPAELRPSLLETIATTPGVAPYFDLSFQHASPTVLRRMKRFGGTEQFLDILERVREFTPDAGARCNVIVGFPGESDSDLAELEDFLGAARLDAVGVFGYSDEEGTEAAGFADKVDPQEIAARVDKMSSLAEQLCAERAAERIGEQIEVLVEGVLTDDDVREDVLTEGRSSDRLPGGPVSADAPVLVGRAAFQAPEVDGVVHLAGFPVTGAGSSPLPARGSVVTARVVSTDGIDLRAEPAGLIR
jgi:ribosomal protein S12 methylthiotransferase RimO